MMTMHWAFPNRSGLHQELNPLKSCASLGPMYSFAQAHTQHLLSNSHLFGARQLLQHREMLKGFSPPAKQVSPVMMSPPKIFADSASSPMSGMNRWQESCYQQVANQNVTEAVMPKRKYKKRAKVEIKDKEVKVPSPAPVAEDSTTEATKKSPDAESGSPLHKRMYKCHDCQYVTDRKNNLKRHIATMHECCTKVLECCDTVFANKALLREHVRSCHSHGYDCKVCGRTFCRKALLKRHITVHSGQKDFVCGLCGYATSHKSNLDRHKRRHLPKHLRKPPFYPDLSNAFSYQNSAALMYDAAKVMSPIAQPAVGLQVPSGYYGQARGFRFTNGQYRTMRTSKRPTKFPTSRLLKKKISNSYRKIMMLKLASKENLTSKPEKKLTEVAESLKEDMDGNEQEAPEKLSRFRIRLAPCVHKCRTCDVVFEGQLDLHRHQDEAHEKEVSAAPQRPLTVAMRCQSNMAQRGMDFWKYCSL